MARKVTGNVAESAIQTDRLSRDFNGLRAVDELTLRVPAGSIFGFLGPNGAGKTTTLRLLLGLLEPSSGSAEVLGHDTRSGACRIRERAGALLEHSGLYERPGQAGILRPRVPPWAPPSSAPPLGPGTALRRGKARAIAGPRGQAIGFLFSQG